MKKSEILSMTCAVLALSPLAMQAQTVAADSVMQHSKGNRLSVGGYGEVALSRNFYSDSGNRYSSASSRKNDPSHGRFDIPHAVIYLGYDFGKGWTLGTEIEFEHGGTGSAIEYEQRSPSSLSRSRSAVAKLSWSSSGFRSRSDVLPTFVQVIS